MSEDGRALTVPAPVPGIQVGEVGRLSARVDPASKMSREEGGTHFAPDQGALMKATSTRRFPHHRSMLSVALFAMAGLAGLPATAHAEFPAFIPTADTPSGVAVDKTGDVYVSVREGVRGVIWKYTPDGMRSFFADVGQAVIYGLAVRANGDV